MDDELIIISRPSKGKHIVVKQVDPDNGVLFVDKMALNAMLIAHANTYGEALQIIENLKKG